MQGSAEAIHGRAGQARKPTKSARAILQAGVGGITESRRHPGAMPSARAVIGFNVRANKEARDPRQARRHRNPLLQHHLRPGGRREGGAVAACSRRHCARPFSATPQILEMFNISKVGKVAGCRVTDGSVERGANVRLIRDNVVDPRRQALAAQALQGRREGSVGRPGMRHGFRELSGHARRRRHRVLPGGDDPALACESKSRGAGEHSILLELSCLAGEIMRLFQAIVFRQRIKSGPARAA